VKRGEYGPDNARVYAGALHAMAALLTEMVEDQAFPGTATLALRGEGGRLRPKVTAETVRRWRFDAALDGAAAGVGRGRVPDEYQLPAPPAPGRR
jgi:hypothetical protein